MIYAVAAIFQYQNKVFAIKRQNSLRVFPGYFSFPGGKVDEDDRKEKTPHAKWSAQKWEFPFLHALVREVQEETGVDLLSLFGQGMVSAPSLFGVAISPPFNP